MEKIIVIGSPGSGKSTFSKQLSKVLKLPIYHLDLIWHNQDKTTITKLEFDQKLDEILKLENWIIDGNYSRTIEKRLKYCDTVFLLDFPVEVCLSGVESRIGKIRNDIPWIEESFDPEFKQSIIDFPTEQLPQIYDLLDQYSDNKEIIIFKTREEMNKYLQSL